VDVQVPVNSRDEFRELADAFNEMTRSLKAKTEQLEEKARENEELLLNILPAPAAQRLREGDGRFTQTFADVTVLFAELRGFDAVSERLGADKALALCQDLVVAFDEAAERFGVEKVKTVGSSYMAVCGLSVERPDHASRMVEFAQEVVRIVKRFNLERGTELSVETGVNAGPVVGGVVGRSKFIFDLWGETVTVAHALPDPGGASIQVTGAVHERLGDLYPFEGPGEAEVKGKGRVPVWSLKV
jgi:class 3 adenylate cyclase